MAAKRGLVGIFFYAAELIPYLLNRSLAFFPHSLVPVAPVQFSVYLFPRARSLPAVFTFDHAWS